MDINSDLVQRGRKKVYSAKQNMELLLPDGKNDGVLEKDDVIYVVQQIKNNGKELFRFRVMKFFETDKESKIYYGDKSFFQPYFEINSNVEGKEAEKEEGNDKPNIKAILATALGLGVAGYFIAQRFNKNKIYFTIGAIILGGLLGKNISKKND
jgi:hypothetical protein